MKCFFKIFQLIIELYICISKISLDRAMSVRPNHVTHQMRNLAYEFLLPWYETTSDFSSLISNIIYNISKYYSTLNIIYNSLLFP